MNLPWPTTSTIILAADGTDKSVWTENRLALLWMLGITPVLLAALITHALPFASNILIALGSIQVWRIVIAPLSADRRIKLTCFEVTQACLFALLLPVAVPAWQLVLAVSFGTVFGERLFGGRGYTFLNPVVVGLSFHLFSYDVAWTDSAIAAVPAIALLPTLLIFLALELVSWRTVVALLVGVMSLQLVGAPSPFVFLGSSALCLALLYLAADPVTGGSSDPARWLVGVFTGLLLALLSMPSEGQLSPIIFALLLASLSAPLIDHLIVKAYTYRRRSRVS